MTPELWREAESVFLAALELPTAHRSDYVKSACHGRPELQAQVASLVAADASAGAFLAEPSAPDPRSWIGRRVGSYRLLECIGSGGMGAVFRAVREDAFRMDVAVKVIGGGIWNPGILSRFLEERQILARLEHPHIARLLDGGATEEGLPYMVLEYVDGRPITGYCRTLPLPARLELFRTVCLAVHHAHQHLVVHRDIKPANILVTTDGTPRLLDFGIAKMLDPLTAGAAATRSLLQPLTPEYASPEQLRGDALTTATDIYSLGVLLYEILTGSRPGESATAPAIVPADAAEPAPPSQRNAGLGIPFSEDLDAIVLKALRPEPQERYASAQEFALDISRFLAGLPVQARRGSAWYSARKMLARHRLAFASAAVSLAFLTAGVAAVAWEAHVARLQRARAEQRFAQLRALAHSVIFELHDGIAPLPGSTPVRRLLVSRALQYLDSLAGDSAGDAGLQVEIASAYRRVGDVQGRWNGSNLGDPMGALASYRKGLQAAESVLAAAPRRDEALSEAGWLHLRIGEIFVETRDVEQARREMEQGLALFRARTAGPDARFDLAAALVNTFIAVRFKDPAAALPYLDQGGGLYEEELRRRPRDTVLMFNLALVDRYRALYGDRASQLRNLHSAEQLDEQRVAANSVDSGARLDLSIDLAEIGGRYLDIGPASDPPTALAYYRRALALREAVAAADPKDVMARSRVAYAQLAVARASLQTGNPSESLQSARRSLALLNPIVASNPANKSAREWIAEDYFRIGQAERQLGHPAQACSAFRQAADRAAPLVSSGPTDDFQGIKQSISRALAECVP